MPSYQRLGQTVECKATIGSARESCVVGVFPNVSYGSCGFVPNIWNIFGWTKMIILKPEGACEELHGRLINGTHVSNEWQRLVLPIGYCSVFFFWKGQPGALKAL